MYTERHMYADMYVWGVCVYTMDIDLSRQLSRLDNVKLSV